MHDPDSGKTSPRSFSFYAVIPLQSFAVLRDLPTSASVVVHVSTDIMGAIQFSSISGSEMTWQTESQTAVPVSYYEFIVSYEEK